MSMKQQLTAVLLIFAASAGVAFATFSSVATSTEVTADDRPAPTDELKPAFDLSAGFKQVARSVRESVVYIRAIQRVEMGQAGGPSPFDDPFFRRFFGDEFDAPEMPRQRERVGQGTGVIVSPHGYIVTNNHVVERATEIQVTLFDDTRMSAEIVGTDAESDLAVIKVDGSNLRAAAFGDSERLEPGEWVLAIGSPFGLQQTVTAGIVSAVGRANMGITTYENFIQTDAAINPGNSGGPLVNLYGEVVGINTAISSRTGTYMGVGFAIPSSMVRMVMEALIEDGRVQRGWLGVQMINLSPEIADSIGYEGDAGILLRDVLRGTPAEQAGLQPGDILVEADGEAIEDSNELLHLVGLSAPGERMNLRIFRDGEYETVSVRLGERGQNQLAGARGQGNTPAPSDEPRIGITVRPLTDEIRAQLDIKADAGVIVKIGRASCRERVSFTV